MTRSPGCRQGDLERIYARKKAAKQELSLLLAATGTTLTGMHGIGPSGAARLLVEVGDITRFPDNNHLASWTGTTPIDASSVTTWVPRTRGRGRGCVHGRLGWCGGDHESAEG